MDILKRILKEGADNIGLALCDEQIEQFDNYHAFLVERNKVMNLTAITGEEETARLHFLDSIALLKICDFKGKSVIDVGSGAGFPGVPLRIAEPEIKLTMLDALQKRINFLSELCTEIGISAECIHARAEEAAAGAMRDSFDFAVSRAVARLNVLCELCMPFVKVGGYFAAMKSVGSDDEIKEAARAIKLLGGRIEQQVDYPIPGTDVMHRVVLIKKVAPTPKGYPRQFAKIKKSPLV